MKIIDHFLTKEEFEIIPSKIDGILETSPLPLHLDLYYQSKDYISHHQDNGGLKEKIYKWVQKINLNYKRNIIAKITASNGKVLDYGCGAGEFIKYIENDFTTFGLEPNTLAKKAAKTKCKNTTLIENLEHVSDNTLDTITLWHVFEHIDNQNVTLNLFYKKLKKDGNLVIAVPNYKSYDANHYGKYWAAYDVPRHIYHFSPTGMKNLFNNSKWKLQNIKPLLFDSFYISILSEKYKKNPLFWISGLYYGVISNFKASKTGDFSSLVYIIKKK